MTIKITKAAAKILRGYTICFLSSKAIFYQEKFRRITSTVTIQKIEP